MNAAIAIIEWMDEDESKCNDCSDGDRVNAFRHFQPANHLHPCVHQAGYVFRLRADKVHVLAVVRKSLGYEVLSCSPTLLRISRIDDCILQLNEGVLARGIKAGRLHECGDESLGAVFARS